MKLKTLFILSLLLLICKLCFSCEFLICTRTDIPDFVGKIVDVKSNHGIYGSSECLPDFYKIRCADITQSDGFLMMDNYTFHIELLSAENRETLLTNGILYLSTLGVSQCFLPKE